MPATFGRSLLLLFAVFALAAPARASTPSKFDPLLIEPLHRLDGRTRVIVRASSPSALDSVVTLVQLAGGTIGRRLPIIDAVVAEVPNTSLGALSDSTLVVRIALDRSVRGTLNRTATTIGAIAARQDFGYDGAGVGVAVIDSGVVPWHDDLATPDGGAQRVAAFVDFVQGQQSPYDDYGHGTHVAGIIVGNGFDSGGARAGVAPGARLVVLRVLDAAGRGRISDVIAAIGYAVEHKDAFGLRVINLSIGAGVFESAATDMLTVAAKKAVDAGIVVVASAGNAGRDTSGRTRYGGITAPGNAPWVLTVGASSHMGTVDRVDDTIAGFSSRGPTAIDRVAKPDLVAPGVGIESLTDSGTALFANKPSLRLNGTVATPYAPYLSLSGTSQAAPVVSGVVAMMLQANPSLTPNAVKAVLQYTAQTHAGYDFLTQGAGFVDARGAVALARFLGSPDTVPFPADTATWSGHLIWGERRVRPGRVAIQTILGNLTLTWGAGWFMRPVVVTTSSCLALLCAPSATTVTYSTSTLVTISLESDNVVWGTCAGGDCGPPDPSAWGATDGGDTVVWGTADGGDTVVWGTTDSGDTVVWGTADDGDTVVWGTADDGDTVVWGTGNDDEVVWDGSAGETAPRQGN